MPVPDGPAVTVSCVVPAWNEAARLQAVLRVLVGHPLVQEVIVVDDASTDATARVAADCGARVVVQPRNGGKSVAVSRGLAEASGSLILFIDADLIGLEPGHVTDLLRPVLTGKADVTISLRANAPWLWRLIGLDYISGERVMPRAMLMDRLPDIRGLSGFGLEVYLNRLWLAAQSKVAIVPLDRVASPSKAAKQGVWRGVHADGRMIADIFRTIGPREVLQQIAGLRRAGRR